jgi:hypothetical protein
MTVRGCFYVRDAQTCTHQPLFPLDVGLRATRVATLALGLLARAQDGAMQS